MEPTNPQPETTGIIRNPDGTFPQGVSGNPAGRPAGSVSITSAIKKRLDEEYFDPDKPEEKKTYLEKIIEAIFHNALKGRDARTLKDIWSYIDGLPKGTLGIEADKESLAALTDYFKSVGNATRESKSL